MRWLIFVLLAGVIAGCGRPARNASMEPVYLVGSQGGLIAFDPVAGKEVRELELPNGGQAAVSHGGNRLWTFTEEGVRPIETDGWAKGDAAPVSNLSTYKLFSPYVSLSADGRWLFALKREITGPGTDTIWIEVFDTAEGRWLPQRLEPTCRTWRPLAAPDGARVYALCEGEISIIERKSGRATSVKLPAPGALSTHFPNTAAAGAVAPDGTLYVARRDGVITAVNPGAGKVLREGRPDLPGGWGVGMEAMALSPDGKQLFIGVGDPLTHGKLKEVWVLSTADFTLKATLEPPAEFAHLALSPNGKALYVLSTGRLYTLDPTSGNHLRDFSVNRRYVHILTPGHP